MAADDDLEIGSAWAQNPQTDSEHNRAQYDELGEHYEEMVADWQYDAPKGAAELLRRHLDDTSGRVLDCACGTGLSGAALHDVGFRNITGVDIAAELLAVAGAKGIYTDLFEVDLQALPIDRFADDTFDATQCVAAMSYIDAEPMFREVCRLTRPGGVALYSQRVDLYEDRDYQAIEQRLADEGLWQILEVTDPQPYLPGHPDFGEDILVRFHAFRVSS